MSAMKTVDRRKRERDCSGALEAFIGSVSFLLGVSLFSNGESLVYILLNYRSLREPLAVALIVAGALSGATGLSARTHWMISYPLLHRNLSLLANGVLFFCWFFYSLVTNSYGLQFPSAIMSFAFIPLLAWIVWLRANVLRDS